jgi:hypothetical protein
VNVWGGKYEAHALQSSDQASGVPLLALATVLVACSPFPHKIAGAASTASALATIAPQSSATPQQATEQLPIPATKYLYPSPDGTLLAAQYDTTIKLYTLGGQEVGSPYTGGGDVWSWLPDSSGVFISQNSGPLLIMDRQGQIHSTGLEVRYPQLSQNGQWIGGTAIDGVSTDKKRQMKRRRPRTIVVASILSLTL